MLRMFLEAASGAIIILGTRLIVSRSSFTYSDLPEGSIRLLNLDTIDPTGQLCCTLIEADQQKLPEYDAISYAWNDEQPTAPIICNGKRLLITPSLHEALRTLQSLQQPRPVWVDAICINQGDDAEKSRQVPLMGTIFPSAHTVVVWLGPAGPNTDQAMGSVASLSKRVSELRREYIDPSRLQCYGLPDSLDAVWQGIGDIYTRKWFTRLWTVQEVALAEHVSILCGSSTTQWQELSLLAKGLLASGLNNVSLKYRNTIGKGFDGFCAMPMLDAIRDFPNGVFSYPLSDLLYHASLRDTSEAVDKIYAILGLTESRLRKKIKVDYSPQSRRQFWKLYVDVGHLMLLEMPDLSLLTMSDQRRHTEIPSWSPDYNTKRGEQEPTLFYLRRYQAGGSAAELQKHPHIASSYDRKRITLRGGMVDQVTEVLQSSWQFWQNQHELGAKWACLRACEWIDKCKILHKGVPGRDQTMDDSLMRCLIANLIPYPTVHVPDKKELGGKFALLNTYLRPKEFQDSGQHLNDTQMGQVTSILNAMESACSGRKLFRTSNDLIGIGPRLIQPGDKICVFRTCKMPLVLRKEPEKEFHEFLGPAYVDGIMHGEALELEKQGSIREEYFEIA